MKKTHKELIILLIGLFINSSITWSQIVLSNGASAGPDIESAVVLCDTDQLSFPAFSGSGTPTATDPGIDPEVNSIWVAWTVGSDGPLTFTITPDNPDVNFDFVLFESFNFREDRGDETIIRNSPATCPGPTGLATTPSTMSCPESFDNVIDLFEGDIYALLIHTTSDDNAFTLSFGGTSDFEGPKPVITHTGGDCFGAPKTIVLQPIDNANIIQSEWTFGDDANITDTIVNDGWVPIIDYANTGSKTVQLTLETDLGCRVVTEYTFDIEACCDSENNIDVDTTRVITASCQSMPTGEIDVSVANPSTLPYTVDWSHDPMEMAEMLTQLEPAIYQIKVENTAGCKDSIAVNLATDNVLTITLITSPVRACNNPSAGKITVQASGGEAPYEYNYGIIQDFVTADTIDNLPFGTYQISVQDASGCIVMESTSIDSLQLELVASSPQNASCKDTINGSIVITEMLGGAAPFTYNFGNGLTGGEAILSQIPGNNDAAYVVTVTDDNGCIGTIDVTITEPEAVFALVDGNAFVDCHGSSTGSLIAIPSGGTPTYEYLWSTGATSDEIENLSPGVYGVTVTDANGCPYMDDVFISEPDSLIATVNAISLSCGGMDDGQLNIVITGGMAPYSYSEDGITFQEFPSNNDTLSLTDLSEGDYTITIRDSVGCIIDELINETITSPSAIETTNTTTLATCGGELDGSITVTASGGSAPYNFEFFQPTGPIGNNDTGTMMGLGIGGYTVTVTDANGCTAAVPGIEITELVLEDITITDTTNLTCFNDNTGSVEIVVNDLGAEGPFRYDFFDGNGPVDAAALTTLSKGDYMLEIYDANNCQGMVPTFSIDEPDRIRAIVEPVRLSCFGDTNGSTIITASGGSGNYTYAWSNGTSERTIDNLGDGAYNVIVTDDEGCSSDTINFSVINPPPITITSINALAVDCPSDPVGSIQIEVTGGAGDYEYSIDNGNTFGDLTILSDLTAADYTITIRDSEGCTKDTTATVNSSVITEQPLIIPEGCYGNIISFPSGEDFVIVSQGTVTNWAWTFGEGADIAFADTPGPHDVIYNSLGTPEVNLMVTLDNGCTFPVNINGAANEFSFSMEPCCEDVNEIIITPEVDSTSCSTTADGNILLDIQSEAAVMDIVWEDDNSITADNRQNLAIGNYTVIVTNAATCTNNATATVAAPTPIVVNNITTSAPGCGGSTDGLITVTASGGTGDYMYNLGNGFTMNNEADDLSIGDYIISVQDENNCVTTDSLVTLSERVVNILSTTITEPTCNGEEDGSIVLNHDGNGPLLSIINNTDVITAPNENGNTITLEDLSADNYNIEIRDAENCIGLIDTTILEPDSITINLAGSNISCFGEIDGAFTTSVSGGSGGYGYEWNNGDNIASISNLEEGIYVITVTDINGCTNTQNGLIAEPNELSVGPPEVQNVFCFGNTDGAITLQGIGGSAPYTYSLEGQSFQTSPTIQNLASGDYTLFVRDNSGCEVSTEGSIEEPGEFSLIVSEDQIVTLGEEIQLNVFASLPEGVIYTWTTPDTLTCNDCPNPRVKPSRSGIYQVTATNPGGCSDSGTISVLVDFDRPIYIPNAFSPNNDGVNDRFFIEGGPAVQSIRRLSIFDRFGAMVYDRSNLIPGDISTGWDGIFNGEALPLGVYIVRAEVDFIDGEVITFVEDVTLAKDR